MVTMIVWQERTVIGIGLLIMTTSANIESTRFSLDQLTEDENENKIEKKGKVQQQRGTGQDSTATEGTSVQYSEPNNLIMKQIVLPLVRRLSSQQVSDCRLNKLQLESIAMASYSLDGKKQLKLKLELLCSRFSCRMLVVI